MPASAPSMQNRLLKKSIRYYPAKANMRITVSLEYKKAESYIKQIPTLFEQNGELIFHKRNIVKRMRTPYGEWIVKRYKRPFMLQRLAYTFWRKSKAHRAFLFASHLRSLNINTPKEVACIEIYKGGLFCEGYFISLPCEWPALFDEMVGERKVFDQQLADATAAFFVTLHQKGVLHGDLNLDNILCKNSGTKGVEFSLIDTNRTRFVSQPTQVMCLTNLVRVTHRRDLLRYIVNRYANLRGWSAERSTDFVIAKLEQFEHRKAIKKNIKRVFLSLKTESTI